MGKGLHWQMYYPVQKNGKVFEPVPDEVIVMRFDRKFGYPPQKIMRYLGSCILAGPIVEIKSNESETIEEDKVQGALWASV